MASDNQFWVQLVARKLHKLYVNGSELQGSWAYEPWDDSISNQANFTYRYQAEQNALTTLQSAGVIKLRTDGVPYETSVSNFNAAAFRAFCDDFSVDLTSGTQAELSLENYGMSPVVRTQEGVYRLKDLRDGGKAQKMVTYCLEHPNTQVPVDGFGVAGLQNVNQGLKDSPFRKDGVLSPFIVATPKSLLVKKIAVLNDEELKAISTASIRG